MAEDDSDRQRNTIYVKNVERQNEDTKYKYMLCIQVSSTVEPN